MTIRIFDIHPGIDRAAAAQRFAREGRVQIRNLLTPESAANLQAIVARQTPWGIACQAGASGPQRIDSGQIAAMPPQQQRALVDAIHRSAAQGDYAVRFTQYAILDAYLDAGSPAGPHDLVLEHLNDTPFLDLVREVTGMPELLKADAQATLFGPGDFLSVHSDSHVAEGWRVAYVLNLTSAEWRPDWGGYLNFLDEDGDVTCGWKPRFNTLNLLRVPQLHQVTYVPPFAPRARFAVTGWLRDR